MARTKAKRTPVRENLTDYAYMSRAEGSIESGYKVQLLPAVFFACCIFLISGMVQIESAYAGLGNLFYMSDSQTTSDFYFYKKAIAVYVCAISALFCFLYRTITGALWVRRSVLYLPLGVYLALVFLSMFFSEYRRIAWKGTDGLYGGAALVLSCGFMLFYIINSVSNERSLKWFLWPLTTCLVVAQILGITQATGHDFFKTAAGQKLLVPNIETIGGEKAWEVIDSLAEQGQTALGFIFDTAVYQTVGNPNYVALYTPLVLPLFAFLFLRARSAFNADNREKRTAAIRRIIWAAVFGLVIFNLFASQSSGALIGAAISLLAGALLSGRRIFSQPKCKMALIFIVIGCAFLNYQSLVGDFSKNVVESLGVERAPDIALEKAEGTVATSSLDYFKRPANSTHKIERIVTGVEGVEVTIDGTSFLLTDNPASLSAAPDFVLASHERRADGKIAITMQVVSENRVWVFERRQEGWVFINDIGKPVRLRDIEHVGDDTLLYLGTGRVYIWSRTVPLLRDTLIVGRGSDTFMLYFPQDDYVGRYNGSWDLRAIIDKPHNLYLNIAFGSGVLSLAAFLVFIGIYLAQSLDLYRRNRHLYGSSDIFPGDAMLADAVGRGVFAGVCGFLAAGMFYDGVTSVMPLFWGMLGLGVACNFICKKALICNNN